MSYYGYHQRIKQRISAGELVDRYFTDHYPGIGEALVLVFSTPPICVAGWADYVDILAEWAKQRGGKDNAIHAGGAGRNGGG